MIEHHYSPKELAEILSCSTNGAIASYLEFLERRGYEISPAERAALDGKAPGR